MEESHKVFLIFNKDGRCIGSSSEEPNVKDLESRNETCAPYEGKFFDVSNFGGYSFDGKKIIFEEKKTHITLDEAIEEVNKFRMKKESEPIQFEGNYYQTERDSIRRLFLASIGNGTVRWANVNNIEIELTPLKIKKILSRTAERSQYTYEYCAMTKGTIRAAAEANDYDLVEFAIQNMEVGYNFE